MTRTEIEYRTLNRDELNALAGEELPENAVSALLDASVAIPIDPSLAAGVMSSATPAPEPPVDRIERTETPG